MSPEAVRVSATGICKGFGGKAVLEGAALEVRAGEVVALVGENGAGKTTLLRICAGLIPAESGEVRVKGSIGYCPQEPGVFELLTAEEHLVLFGRALGLPRRKALAQGQSLLEGFGFPLGERGAARDLSAGTKQKLNLALALLGDPSVLLLDEPYQGFDRGTYVNFWDHVRGWRRDARAVVIVTHMLAELNRVDRIIELPLHPSRRATEHGQRAQQ